MIQPVKGTRTVKLAPGSPLGSKIDAALAEAYDTDEIEPGNWPEVDPPKFRVGDLVEDFEGDKAEVREVHDDGTLSVEWDCRPGYIAHLKDWEFTNLSARVRELDS